MDLQSPISGSRLDFEPVLIPTLINLKHISDGAITELREKHKMFLFDQSLSVLIKSRGFLAHFYLKSEQQNGFNNSRVLRRIKHIKVVQDISHRFEVNKFLLIKRLRSNLEIREPDGVALSGKSHIRYYI
jgi:hypothetical protein